MLTREQRAQKQAQVDALSAEIEPIQKELDEIRKGMDAYSRKHPGKNPHKEKKFWEDRSRHGAANWSLAEIASTASNERMAKWEHQEEIDRRERNSVLIARIKPLQYDRSALIAELKASRQEFLSMKQPRKG